MNVFAQGVIDLPRVELGAIAPELALVAGAFVVLLIDVFIPHGRGRWQGERFHLPLLATIAFAYAGWLAIDHWGGNELQLARMVVLDNFSIFVKVTLAIFGLLTVWLGREYFLRERSEESEFYALVLFSTAGMMLMASSADLIMIFLALETFSIALYVLVGLRRGSLRSQESALKYFLLGSFSSAFFLLGIAFAYGAVETTNLYGALIEGGGSEPGLMQSIRTVPAGELGLLVLAAGLLVIGLGFKVAAVPFHMWTPDAYEGAPSPITGFMAAGSKLAGFAVLLRLLDVVLFSLRWDWRPLVIGIAVITMLFGSILAVAQENLKRMLAYSSIAHAGFVLTGIVAETDKGVSGSLFYLATYGLTIVGAFAVVSMMAGRGEARGRLVDFKGLFYQRPLLAGALTLFLLSLAGVPLTSGFVAKLVVFGPAIEAGYASLVVIGMIASAIAAFFYLRVMVVMYMQEPDQQAVPLEVAPLTTGVVAFAALATLVLGLFWGPLIDLAERATLFAGVG